VNIWGRRTQALPVDRYVVLHMHGRSTLEVIHFSMVETGAQCRPREGPPDTGVEVDTLGGAAGSISRTFGAGEETIIGLSLSSDEGHNEREAVDDSVA